MRRGGMPEAVWRESSPDRFVALDNSNFFSVFVNDAGDLALTDTEDFVFGGSARGEFFEELRGLGIDQAITILIALAVAHENFQFVEVEVSDENSGDLTDSHGAGVESTEEKIVARLGLGSLEELMDLGAGKDGRQSVPVLVGAGEKFAGELFMPSSVNGVGLLPTSLLLVGGRRGFHDLEGLGEGGLLGHVAGEEAEGGDVIGEFGKEFELLGSEAFSDAKSAKGGGGLLAHASGIRAAVE